MLMLTYYVVAQLGLNNLKDYFAFGYMLGTVSLGHCLLYKYYYYLFKIDDQKILNFLSLYSKNDNRPAILNNTDTQSAENCKGFSETTRQISDLKGKNLALAGWSRSWASSRRGLDKFFSWLAGVIDGDGNFDVRYVNSKLVLKAIRIKLHNRDIRILTYIQNTLHMGAVWCGISLLCLVKLSNSGDTLKLLIPNHVRKYVSGWTNHSGKVISQKMIEREMGYRGSKSDNKISVKEQRVDGSWLFNDLANPGSLRCTLMDFERNYRIKVPSKQINIHRGFHSSRNLHNTESMVPTLNPWFVTGFVDDVRR
jgi:LAGLIDADG endonuclease.